MDLLHFLTLKLTKQKYSQECNGCARFIKLLSKNFKIPKKSIRLSINQQKRDQNSKYQKIKMEI